MGQFIQDNRYALLILAIFVYAAITIYRYQRRQAFEREYQYLLHKGSLQECRDHLYSKTGRRIYHEYELKLRELDAALQYDHRDEARALFEELFSAPMREKDFVDFHNKALQFAVEEKDPEMAEKVCAAFSRHRRHAGYAAEARQVTDIYLHHKANHIQELIASADKKRKPSQKATAYYRIARQYYSLGETETCRKYLEMAYTVFPDKTWQKLIDELLKGNYEQFD